MLWCCELQDVLPRGDELLVLIVEALEAVAADAARGNGTAPCRDSSVAGLFGDHVGGVALLAAGVEIFGVVERPEPVLVAAVGLFDRVEGAAVAAVAGRAAEFFQRMDLQQLRVGMGGEGRILAVGHAQVGLGQRS